MASSAFSGVCERTGDEGWGEVGFWLDLELRSMRPEETEEAEEFVCWRLAEPGRFVGARAERRSDMFDGCIESNVTACLR